MNYVKRIFKQTLDRPRCYLLNIFHQLISPYNNNNNNNYYYYYYYYLLLFSRAFSPWYFSWTSSDPHRSRFKLHTAVLSVFCVIFQVKLSFVVNLTNVFAAKLPNFSLSFSLLFQWLHLLLIKSYISGSTFQGMNPVMHSTELRISPFSLSVAKQLVIRSESRLSTWTRTKSNRATKQRDSMLHWSQSLEPLLKGWLYEMEKVGMLVICWRTSYEMEQTFTLGKKKNNLVEISKRRGMRSRLVIPSVQMNIP